MHGRPKQRSLKEANESVRKGYVVCGALVTTANGAKRGSPDATSGDAATPATDTTSATDVATPAAEADPETTEHPRYG